MGGGIYIPLPKARGKGNVIASKVLKFLSKTFLFISFFSCKVKIWVKCNSQQFYLQIFTAPFCPFNNALLTLLLGLCKRS